MKNVNEVIVVELLEVIALQNYLCQMIIGTLPNSEESKNIKSIAKQHWNTYNNLCKLVSECVNFSFTLG